MRFESACRPWTATLSLRAREITWVLSYIRDIDRALFFSRRTDQSRPDRDTDTVRFLIPPNLGANVKFIRLLIQQQDTDVWQMEVIAGNNQDLLQDLVQLKRRQYRLAGIVQNCDFLHNPCRILTCGQRVTYVPKVT